MMFLSWSVTDRGTGRLVGARGGAKVTTLLLAKVEATPGRMSEYLMINLLEGKY